MSFWRIVDFFKKFRGFPFAQGNKKPKAKGVGNKMAKEYHDYHQYLCDAIDFHLYRESLPFTRITEKYINSKKNRYDIGLLKNDKCKGGDLLDETEKRVLFEYKPVYKKIDFKSFIQLRNYLELNSMEPDAKKGDRKATGIICGFSQSIQLKEECEEFGIKLEPRSSGVYNVVEYSNFHDFRLVLLNELSGNEYACFRILGKKATENDIRLFINQARQVPADNTFIWSCIEGILAGSSCFNKKKVEKAIKEVCKMDQRFAQMIGTGRSTAIRQAVNEGRTQGRVEGRAEGMAEGMAKGMAEGMAKGMTEGMVKGKTKVIDYIIASFFSDGMEASMITMEELRKIREMTMTA